jgi:uncharacterized protein YggE
MRGAPLVVAVLMSVSGAANAQAPSDAGPHAAPATVTHLHLSADGSVSVPPDELVATLVATAKSPSAAAAQHQVNALMAQGLKEAQAIVGIDARAVGDSVQSAEPLPATVERPASQRSEWVAEQTLELRSNASEQLLDLVGKLQGIGFVAAGLDWQLSPALGRKARDAAMQEALKALQARTTAAAAVLGLRLDHLQDVEVDMRDIVPVRPMMAAMRGGPPPQATAAQQAVTSEVSADVVLRP